MDLLLGANVLEATNLLLTHSRHDRHNQIFTFTKSILDLHDKILNQYNEVQIIKVDNLTPIFITKTLFDNVFAASYYTTYLQIKIVTN